MTTAIPAAWRRPLLAPDMPVGRSAMRPAPAAAPDPVDRVAVTPPPKPRHLIRKLAVGGLLVTGMAVALTASSPAAPVALPFTVPSAATLAKPAPTTPFTQELISDWPAIDYQNTPGITPQEVQIDMQNAAFSGNSAAAVATLQDIQATDAGLVLTHSSLDAYQHIYQSGTFQTWDNMYSANQAKVADQSHALYGSAGVPQWTEMSQGDYVGDCYFESAVGGMVYRNPSAIMQMIQQNPHGTFTVTFPGQSPVTVKAPTEAEMAHYASAGADGTWLSVLEKAYGQKVNNGAWQWNRTTEPYESEAHGGLPAHGIEAMTGHSVKTLQVKDLSQQQLSQTLQQGLADGRLVTASNMPDKSVDGIPGNHSLAVLRFDPASGSVTLWNPWGWQPANMHLDDMGNGEFQINIHDFAHAFTQLDIEQAT